MNETRLRSLLRQARKVADNGKRAAALELYRQIVDEAPESEAAWLGIAALESDPATQATAYEMVLTLNPENEAARQFLAGADPAPAAAEAAAAGPETGAALPHEQAEAWLERVTNPPPARVPEPAPAADGQGPAGLHVHRAEPAPADAAAPDSFELFCYRHPNRSTALRCYSCGKPICSQCAVKTPVGYRCPDCVREAEDVFFNARPLDYLVAPLVSLPLSIGAGFLVSLAGGGFLFILIILFAGGAAGSFIGRLAKQAVGRRRGRYLPHLVAATVVLGALIPAAPYLLAILVGNLGAAVGLLVPGIYMFVATSAAFYQMK